MASKQKGDSGLGLVDKDLDLQARRDSNPQPTVLETA